MARWVIGLCAAGALVLVSAAGSQVVAGPTVVHSAALPSGSVKAFTVRCAPGYLAVSAGVSSAAAGVTTLTIRPSGPRAYGFRFGNPSTNQDRKVTVAVACRKLPARKGARSTAPFLKLVPLKSKPVSMPGGTQKQVVLTCPQGTLPAGGGLDLGGSRLEIRRQSENLSRFTFWVRNNGGEARSAVLYGNCLTAVRPAGSAPGRLQVKVLTQTTPVQPGSHTIRRACPVGWNVLAAGYTLAPGLTLGGAAAIGGGGRWTIANGAGQAVLADLQLTCARVA
jgi:hypothetical protein